MDSAISNRSQSLKNNYLWVILGSALLLLFLILTIISTNFKYEIPILKKPILWLVSILAISGVVYLFLIGFLKRTVNSKSLLIWIIAIGIGLRIVTMFSTPILEDDYFRYFWDGAVTANGFNPYRYAPQTVMEGDLSVPAEIQRLAEESGAVIERINHPHIRTIYPPVTHAFFAASYFLSPYNVYGWRIILLFVDVINLILLLYLLKFLNLPSVFIAVYWWNPLLIKEIFNSGHMDILIIPFVFGAILLLMRNKPLWASGLLALGMGIKLWPVILFPLFMRLIFPDIKKVITGLFIFISIGILLFLPVYSSGIDQTLGFEVYGRSWENNDSLFMLFVWGWQLILTLFGIHPGHGQFAARVTVFVILFAIILFLMLRRSDDDWTKFLNRCLFIIAAAFLISPTQFPWYFIWVIPFLTVNPKMSILILTALLPLYYLRFYLEPRGLISLFNYGVVWIEFLPVWILLTLEWIKSRKNRTTSPNSISTVS